MASYRYMTMMMNGVIEGNQTLTKEDVLSRYQMSPESMTMNMHMLGLMYAISDHVTFMLMGNYNTLRMNSVWMQHNPSGEARLFEFDNDGKNSNESDRGDTKNSGLSDARFGAMIKLLNYNKNSLHANISVMIPTGSITEKGTSMSKYRRSPYPMQLGTGSWGTMLGMTYLVQGDRLSAGVQPSFMYYFGNNGQGYKLGNKTSLRTWGSARVNNWVSVSGQLRYQIQEAISGSDPVLEQQKQLMFSMAGNRYMMPGLESKFTGRESLDVGIGSNFYIPQGLLKNVRFGAECLIPVYQNANGIQMKNGLSWVFGLQYAIGNH